MLNQKIPFAPKTNSGANSQNDSKVVLNIDNITVTKQLDEHFTPQHFLKFIAEVCQKFHSEYALSYDSERHKKKQPYHHSGRATNGILFWWSEIDPESGTGSCRIEFTGTSLAETDIYDEILLITGLSRRGFNFTRLDPNFDDYGKRLDPNHLVEADLNGWIKGQPTVDARFNPSKGGFTIRIGASGAKKAVRFYDKSVESKGKIDAYRFEGQLRGDYARDLATKIYAIGTKILRKKTSRQVVIDYLAWDILEHAIGLWEFIIPKGNDKNKSRGTVCPFWKDFCDSLNATPVKVKVQRAKSKFETTEKWFEKSTPRHLAMQAEIYGIEKVMENVIDLVEAGKRKFTGFDKAQIRQQKKLHKKPEITIRWAS